MPTPSPETPNIGGLLQSLKAANQQTASAAAKLAKAAKNPEVLKPRYDSIKGNTLEENMAKETPDASVNIPPDVPVRTDPVEKVQLIDLTKASSASPVSADPVSPPPDPTATTQPPSGGRVRGKKQSATAAAAATAGKSGVDKVQAALMYEISASLKGIESTLGLMHTGVSRKLDDIEKANDKYYKVSEKLQTSLLEEIQKITKSVGGVEKSLKEDVLKKVEDDREGDKGKGKGKIPRPSSTPKRRRKGSRTLLGDLMSLGGFFAGVLGTVLKKFWGMALKGIIGGIKDIFERVLPVVFNRLIPSLVKGMGAFLKTTAGQLLGGAAIGLGVEELAKYGFEKITGVDPRNMQGGDDVGKAMGGQAITHLAAIAAATAALGPVGGIGAAVALIVSDSWKIYGLLKDIAKDTRDTKDNDEKYREGLQKLKDAQEKKIDADKTTSDDQKKLLKEQAAIQRRANIGVVDGQDYQADAEEQALRASFLKAPASPERDEAYFQRFGTKIEDEFDKRTLEPKNPLRIRQMTRQNRMGMVYEQQYENDQKKLQIDQLKVAPVPNKAATETSAAIEQSRRYNAMAQSMLAVANVGNVNTVNNVNTSETGILASAFSFRAEEKRIPPMLARGG